MQHHREPEKVIERVAYMVHQLALAGRALEAALNMAAMSDDLKSAGAMAATLATLQEYSEHARSFAEGAMRDAIDAERDLAARGEIERAARNAVDRAEGLANIIGSSRAVERHAMHGRGILAGLRERLGQ